MSSNKELLLQLRVNKQLKGKRPAVVYINRNIGEIYRGKRRHFVVTITKNEELYFHGLTAFFKKYNSKFDFTIPLSKFIKYTYSATSYVKKDIVFYQEDGKFLPISYFAGIKDTYESELNLDFLMNHAKELGIVHSNILPLKEDVVQDEE